MAQKQRATRNHSASARWERQCTGNQAYCQRQPNANRTPRKTRNQLIMIIFIRCVLFFMFLFCFAHSVCSFAAFSFIWWIWADRGLNAALQTKQSTANKKQSGTTACPNWTRALGCVSVDYFLSFRIWAKPVYNAENLFMPSPMKEMRRVRC